MILEFTDYLLSSLYFSNFLLNSKIFSFLILAKEAQLQRIYF